MNKWVKRCLNTLLVIFLVFVTVFSVPSVNADSGWDSDYDSGGWDSSSSWDSDWDSGSDWDSDWDSDWSSSSWDDDYSYSGGSSDAGDIVIGMFIFIVVIIVIASTLSKKSPPRSYRAPNHYEPSVSSLYQDITDSRVKEFLPNESLLSLKRNTYNTFVEIQNAWSNFDYDKLRELCTDELYNSYVEQLETLKLKMGKNIMSDFNQLITKIIDIKEENGNITLTVYLQVSFYDYVINTKSGDVTRGRNNVKITNNYVMTFVKGSEEITSAGKVCPHCGAPIENITSGECEYCNSTIVTKATKFVLSKKTNVNR